MKTILHIGMHKTGTSTLQQAFHTNREKLLARGVLYPSMPGDQSAHHVLSPLLVPAEKVWWGIQNEHDFDSERILNEAMEAWAHIKNQIDRYKPEFLILSSEAFFADITDVGTNILPDLIRELGGTAEVVAYLRDPVGYFKAVYLEDSKRQKHMYPVHPISYRRQIESYGNRFEGRISLRPYARDQLFQNDILADFNQTCLNGRLMPEDLVQQDHNLSLTPEAALVFQKMKSAINEGERWSLVARDYYLLERLQKLGDKRKDGGTTRMRPEVRRYVAQASRDVFWLRDVHNFEFRAFDYGVSETGEMERPGPSSISQVFETDDAEVLRISKRMLYLFPELSGAIIVPGSTKLFIALSRFRSAVMKVRLIKKLKRLRVFIFR